MRQIRQQNGITILADADPTGAIQMGKMMKILFELPDGSACELDAMPDAPAGMAQGGWPAQFVLAESLRTFKSTVNDVQTGRHGGKRQGAGRPADHPAGAKKAFTASLPLDVIEHIKGKPNQARYIERLVRADMGDGAQPA